MSTPKPNLNAALGAAAQRGMGARVNSNQGTLPQLQNNRRQTSSQKSSPAVVKK
jgi:hypothetical protein